MDVSVVSSSLTPTKFQIRFSAPAAPKCTINSFVVTVRNAGGLITEQRVDHRIQDPLAQVRASLTGAQDSPYIVEMSSRIQASTE
jgi:hypothetical protein